MTTKLINNDQGLQITRTNGNIFRIDNSQNMSTRVAAKTIESIGYSAFMSENRIGGKLEFTVVPYAIDPRFKKATCTKKEMSAEDLWSDIESTKSPVEHGKPVIVCGKQIFESPAQALKEMSQDCNKISSLVVEFLDQAPSFGTVLDLGCGIGVNSLPLLMKGWNVIAIDISSSALDLYRNSVLKADKKYLETGKLTLIHNDITTHEFPSNQFNLVICIDVFSYVESTKLKVLMNKIHQSLVPNGQLFGTLHFSQHKTPFDEFAEKLGRHHYRGAYIVPSLLEHTGFEAQECSIEFEEEVPPNCVQFIAKKTG